MSRRGFALLLVALSLFSLSKYCKADASDAEVTVAEIDSVKLAAWADEVKIASATGQSAVQQTDLPASRPQARDLCGYDCASKITIKTLDAEKQADKLDQGVLFLDMTFKPIPKINGTMMKWLFENLAGRALAKPENKLYPLYLIFHPRDHVVHRRTGNVGDPIVAGTNLTWCEMILTNCKYDGNAAYNPATGAGPWSCPPDAPGYLRSTPKAEWKDKYQTKETMTVQWFNESGIEFSRIDASEQLVGAFKSPRVVATTRHTWTPNRAGTGLVWTTKLWIGIMKENSSTEFDTSLYAPFANGIILDTILGGVTNVGTNATQLAWMNALHFLEEYHGTSRWLPQLWRSRTKKP